MADPPVLRQMLDPPAIGEKLAIFKDYPTSKGCTSPFATIWIHEMVRRQKDG